jgi:phage terminase small subunit
MTHSKSAKRFERFAREYLIDLNGTRAAIAAGYSEASASAKASQLLSNVRVQRLIDRFKSERASRLQIKADKVLEEIARLAFSNMQDFTRIDGEGKPVLDLSDIDRDKLAAVQEVREDTTGGSGDGERKRVVRTTVKLADKTRNLELLGRHLKMFNDKLDLNVRGRLTLEQVLEAKKTAGK